LISFRTRISGNLSLETSVICQKVKEKSSMKRRNNFARNSTANFSKPVPRTTLTLKKLSRLLAKSS